MNCGITIDITRQPFHTPSDSEGYVDVTEEPLSNVKMEENSAYNVVTEGYVDITEEPLSNVKMKGNSAYNVVTEDYVDVTEEPLSNMRMEGNSAYNVTVRATQGGAVRFKVVDNHSKKYYEEVSERVESHQPPVKVETRETKPISTKATSPGKALVSFWQGKVEIAVRIAILVVSVCMKLIIKFYHDTCYYTHA